MVEPSVFSAFRDFCISRKWIKYRILLYAEILNRDKKF